MKYLEFINQYFPIRRRREEKERFAKFVKEKVEENGYAFKDDVLDNKHHNLIIGDLEKADVVFTAHYDTPATSIVPNIMMPRNKVVGYLYHFSYPIIMAFLALFIAYAIGYLLDMEYNMVILLYVFLYLGMFYLATRCFTNKHNYNDNTSGVSVILSLLSRKKFEKVAFVLFDNEEKGLLGSKALNKHYPYMKEKLVINFDCVGCGNHFILICKEAAAKSNYYKELVESVNSSGDYEVHYFPLKGSTGNSDYKSFDQGIGVMSCHKNKIVGYYTSKIHTNKDKIANEENILFITDKFEQFLKNVNLY